MDELPDLKEAPVKCTTRDCDNDKHAFQPKRGQWTELPAQIVCQGCGDSSVDMSIPRAKDLAKREAILDELGREFIRDHYLNKDFDKRARRLIRRDGLQGTRDRALGRLKSAIGGEPNDWDGRQTPFEGNVLYYAQHATATCCRKCTWYWYGIPRNGKLSESDLEFCHGLVQAYLDRRAGAILAIAASPADNDDDD